MAASTFDLDTQFAQDHASQLLNLPAPPVGVGTSSTGIVGPRVALPSDSFDLDKQFASDHPNAVAATTTASALPSPAERVGGSGVVQTGPPVASRGGSRFPPVIPYTQGMPTDSTRDALGITNAYLRGSTFDVSDPFQAAVEATLRAPGSWTERALEAIAPPGYDDGASSVQAI